MWFVGFFDYLFWETPQDRQVGACSVLVLGCFPLGAIEEVR